MTLTKVSPQIFKAMQNLNISKLASYTQDEIRPILPSLVRMSLLSPLDNTKSSMDARREILSILVGIEVINNIVAFLQVNYHELEVELKKEQQLRQKAGYVMEMHQTFGLQNGIALGFERADVTRKVRVVLSEIFSVQSQLDVNGGVTSRGESLLKQSELFDDGIYLEEITDIICIALAELPSLLNIHELIETLVYVNNGPNIICSIVANFPDCYKDVVSVLISNCDEETPEGKLKIIVLIALSEMNPGQALSSRNLCVDLMKAPSLMLRLSLNDPNGLIAFISGLLLGNDQNVRTWFALFARTSQKRKVGALQLVREQLMKQLQEHVSGCHFSNGYTVQASAFLRLYCALRGVAGIKFNDEEIQYLVQLITSRPPPTQAGIRFVSLGLCLLIACSSLLSNASQEQKIIEWLQWLIKEESFIENTGGMTASFGEMLLLMAIHFHSNQISAIGELVCTTLAMKVPIRANNTTRMKIIFTQELFTEQIVAAHAVKVPVTIGLNANIDGYLPVHCIHQLLKSRAFLKHKVSIKSWIYKQICCCIKPLHPVMPTLIDVYVNSLLLPTPANKGMPIDHLHKPLTENEILNVFRNSIAGSGLDSNAKQIHCSEISEPVEIIDDTNKSELDIVGKSNLTTQLLILYYVVQYEDVRLANMAQIIQNKRKVKTYSNEFLSELPIKYLLQKATKYQQEYVGLFQPLLRLLVTHFPHLNLVDDWIEVDHFSSSWAWTTPSNFDLQKENLVEAFKELETNPSKTMTVLRIMLKKPPKDIWRFSKVFVENINKILNDNVPRLIQELYKKVWMRLNFVLPRQLWTMTITALIPTDLIVHKYSLTQQYVLLDPLQVLRSNERVFRCPDILIIVLRILQASLAASKNQLSRHIQDKPIFDKSGQVQSEMEREELKTVLVASQESAAVQILLESCILTDMDTISLGKNWTVREMRGIICSYIHQAFISEPPLAKLVHYQTYPLELLPMTVRCIPSMHICIDWLADILSMQEMEKHIFTLHLMGYLSLQYAIPRSLGVAKLCINSLVQLLGHLSSDSRIQMFQAVLPSIVCFGEAFPVLLDECIQFLMQLGRIVHSQTSLGNCVLPYPILSLHPGSKTKLKSKRTEHCNSLLNDVRKTFSHILKRSVHKWKLY